MAAAILGDNVAPAMGSSTVIFASLAVGAAALYLLYQQQAFGEAVKNERKKKPAYHAAIVHAATETGFTQNMLTTFEETHASLPNASHHLDVQLPAKDASGADIANALGQQMAKNFGLSNTVLNQADGSLRTPSAKELDQFEPFNVDL